MQYVSIGFTRSDGDFELLATLNNGANFLSDDDFAKLVKYTKVFFEEKGEDILEVLERQDAPDIVTLD